MSNFHMWRGQEAALVFGALAVVITAVVAWVIRRRKT
jgi:hypothetical protein